MVGKPLLAGESPVLHGNGGVSFREFFLQSEKLHGLLL